ncbi:pimeloyl-ACP methyl ester carboxylesterase [Catenuloplanes nepalensis]|uniref:Pimeloyl-ACP methyl ester carboxylesterase n=1 Tax=Catenuloplanes nepalensis TaxID=587533 RepID=A0ABT9MT10_9ACTN|nr:alpha/beta hydrolase [Catenuloplanes nepalensis]MDP9794576.1 pimeloyl-ACP methyl ester carboxylesterase [Catenuloplanes nepalensis]
MQTAHHGDVRLAYETFGDPGGVPLLLIMGLDFQMVLWPDGFCRMLARRGFHVARFDNRDTGLSTHFASPAAENPFRMLFRGSAAPAYTGLDMVSDGVAVMDALGWRSAHVCGTSLGGGLALATAVLHPDRVRGVTSIMAGPLGRRRDLVRYVNFGVFPRIARIRHPATDAGAIDTLVDLIRLISSPRAPFDERWARSVATLSHSRSPRDPGTTQRQTAAGLRLGPVARRFHEITAPVLIVNGADDPLIRPSAGAALARRIPGARAVVHPRMGHTLPPHVWPLLTDAMAIQAGIA